MHARLRGSKSLLKLLIKPDFPSLGVEIAEPHLDMNINVAAFTESEKSSNMSMIFWCLSYMRYFIIMAAQPSRRLVTLT